RPPSGVGSQLGAGSTGFNLLRNRGYGRVRLIGRVRRCRGPRGDSAASGFAAAHTAPAGCAVLPVATFLLLACQAWLAPRALSTSAERRCLAPHARQASKEKTHVLSCQSCLRSD